MEIRKRPEWGEGLSQGRWVRQTGPHPGPARVGQVWTRNWAPRFPAAQTGGLSHVPLKTGSHASPFTTTSRLCSDPHYPLPNHPGLGS